MNRRGFLAAGATAATAAAVTLPALGRDAAHSGALIDTNVSLGQWPFRRCPLDDTAALVSNLRSHRVSQAWAGTFDAVLHKDISSANARLAEECRKDGGGILVAVGAINPLLPGWEEDLRRCGEWHRMPGIRLHPNYHGYPLHDGRFEDVLSAATQRGLFVQIALTMEDPRTVHPLLKLPVVSVETLPALLKKHPRSRVQLLNALGSIHGRVLSDLATSGARFEIATLEGVEGITNLLGTVPAESVFFGSHAPFYYFESALMKLRESALSPAALAALSRINAQNFLHG